MKKNWKLLVISLFLLTLSACGNIEVPDVEACIKSQIRGYCSTTVTNKKRIVDHLYLNEVGRVSMTTEDFGKLKKFVHAVCKKSNKCQKEFSEQINTFLDQE